MSSVSLAIPASLGGSRVFPEPPKTFFPAGSPVAVPVPSLPDPARPPAPSAVPSASSAAAGMTPRRAAARTGSTPVTRTGKGLLGQVRQRQGERHPRRTGLVELAEEVEDRVSIASGAPAPAGPSIYTRNASIPRTRPFAPEPADFMDRGAARVRDRVTLGVSPSTPLVSPGPSVSVTFRPARPFPELASATAKG